MIAVLLTIGFYLMAVAIALGLLFIPYAEWTLGGRLHIKLAILCIAGGLAILWSVLPQGGAFTIPGPELKRDQEPELFAELEAIARAANQPMPSEVYLVSDLNAWVSQRGGFLGIGGKRIMGLGLPLMRVLKVPEFRAVLAHEFGHYHSGDTKLGPWVYQTHRAIGRTLHSLGGDSIWESILRFPFKVYGKVFLRITHAISRQQEFVADALAARVAGAASLATGLLAIHRAAPAYDAFWRNDYLPLLQRGFRAPLLGGFSAFTSAESVQTAMEKQVEHDLETGQADPYDTHPTLRERIEALREAAHLDIPPDDRPADMLLADVESYEIGLVEAVVAASPNAPEELPVFAPLAWSAVAREIDLPRWRQFVAANPKALAGLTPERLPDLTSGWGSFTARVVALDGSQIPPEHAAGAAAHLIGAALAIRLCDRGAVVERLPGQPCFVRLNHASLEPFAVLPSLAEGTLTAEAWRQTCGELGIAGTKLSGATVNA